MITFKVRVKSSATKPLLLTLSSHSPFYLFFDKYLGWGQSQLLGSFRQTENRTIPKRPEKLLLGYEVCIISKEGLCSNP